MRDGQMPLGGFGFIDDHHVGDAGQLAEHVRIGAGRRGVEHHRGTTVLRQPRRRQRGGRWDLQLQQQHVAVGDDRANVCGVQGQVRVGARRHHDHVLGVVADHDGRGAAGDRQADGADQADTVVLQMLSQHIAGGVGPERGDQLHIGTRPCRGDGLIAALAAGLGMQRRRQHRLPRSRQVGEAEHQIHVDAAHDGDPSHPATVAPTGLNRRYLVTLG
ncbi:Uncharacterised protein [Mycobacteroides abscessus subsp. abscessus]|nr:Uncharacterised protein [Mycobacteroides abscessus subsp. abscessus]